VGEHGGKRAARRAAERAEADAHERRKNRKSTETCEEFAARWTDDYPIVKHGPTRGQRKSDKTLRAYRDELKPFVSEFRGARLADVDRPMARRYANAHPRSAVVVRNMFSDAVDDGLIDANPFANLQLEQARGRSQHPTITEEELHDLADCAVVVLGQAYGQVYSSFILATGYVGCRLNEGLNLEHRDLRSRERDVDLRVTKFSKPRTVLLLPEAWDAIRTIPRQAMHDRVWYAKRGGPLTKGTTSPCGRRSARSGGGSSATRAGGSSSTSTGTRYGTSRRACSTSSADTGPSSRRTNSVTPIRISLSGATASRSKGRSTGSSGRLTVRASCHSGRRTRRVPRASPFERAFPVGPA
jgi:integrase